MALVVHGKMLLMKRSLVLLAAATTLLADKTPSPPQAKPNCPDRCGNLSIPYPFGIGEGCYLPLKGKKKQFELACNYSTKPPSLTWPTDRSASISGFHLAEGELEVMNSISKDCYNKSGFNVEEYFSLSWSPPFSLSGRKNSFVAIGCDTSAAFLGFRGQKQIMTGCMSVCLDINTVDLNSCTGVGCCQTKIPDELNNLTVRLDSYFNHSYVREFNPCSYAFVVKDGYFNFSGTRSFKELKNMEQVPLIGNWQIGNETCDVAKKNAVSYACKANSVCVNRSKSPWPAGYYCQCSPGYEGNPYIGCRDIDECLAEINPCGNGTCKNIPGSYSCKCKKGFKSDGPFKCIARPTANNSALKISLGICIGFFVLLVVIFGLYREYKRRQFNEMKKKYFEANGGPKLQLQLKQLASQKEPLAVQIFTEEELKKATKNYDENEKLGEGGYGIVYKGVLDKRVVAIKISKMTAQVESDQFINEVIVLSQISHRNVVRLLGCCLETKTPMLVYEYVGSGTLYDHIHKKKGQLLSFAQRLKIAAETATALSYLHHSTTTQIVHRDVKATNILLDEKLMAKVSDFGASKLIPDDKTQLSTLVQGTLGYLDPEYLQSNTLTEKSDVYSFGVVLVELLTSENVIRFDKTEAERNLANVFVSTIEKKGLRALGPILDDEIVKDGNWEIIEKVANLAQRCLSVKGDERPTMKEIERELDEIRKTSAKQPDGKKLYASSSKETDPSLESHSDAYNVEISDEGDGGSTGIISSTEYDASMQNQAQKSSSYGR
ncbi:putative protein kinase RLK-Pelle-WAK family [Rosa chinensis]|uniref:Protein kinase domain-containing protein n=1 Tax=Rosa chinensis TaxID=74649 RepID=A0A2P6SB23_ROSCH|nr:wall-associated receptor kinase 2 [Rosa chinensis]PRQ55882.1 putative protein kinase RLK-Pelle-WAK family [Rosa chinensis]